MKLKILNDKIGPGKAKGINDKKEIFIVVGGDLCYGKSIDVTILKSEKNRYILSTLDYNENEILRKYIDKDGLIEFIKLKEVNGFSKPYNRIYELNGYWFFIPIIIRKEVEYLYENKLLEYSKIRITRAWASTFLRAPIISVNYKTILKKILNGQNNIRSHYFCEKKKDFSKGVYADLFIIGNKSEGRFQLQMWQIIDDGSELLYSHSIMDNDNLTYTHFDLASHFADKLEIEDFINYKKRLKICKKKWLKIDGKFTKKVVMDLTKLFFPYDYLINEFDNNNYDQD